MVLHENSFWHKDEKPATCKRSNIGEAIKLTSVELYVMNIVT